MENEKLHWVFGYGSLIWNPGFAFVRQMPATLLGAHRRLSVLSHRHRGTAARPGLVFGLVRGGSCRGMAFGVAPEAWEEAHDYLVAREMDNGVYLETVRPVQMADRSRGPALTFMVDERHAQFAGKLDLKAQLEIVLGAVGESGPNPDYVRETAAHLSALGMADRYLDALVAEIDARAGPSP
ncbi:gamma-glutamylcyclotransferase [Devosia sp.]|uniref:gamma-glutamylcyclotransferase n=1 Tax=Devosia sp. TaxID=1871048 RepID=UPI003A9160F0